MKAARFAFDLLVLQFLYYSRFFNCKEYFLAYPKFILFIVILPSGNYKIAL